MDNMNIFDKAKAVPSEYLKKIVGGRLKGMTDINPMWRIKKMTEIFGVCGLGWYYEITKQWLEVGADGVTCAFTNINLYIKDTNTNEWSKPIQGTGGSSFISAEKNKLYTSDECFKMSLTDAISVACKALGVGAEVYQGFLDSKYSINKDNKKDEEFFLEEVEEEDFRCVSCGNPFRPWTDKNGNTYSAERMYHFSKRKNIDNVPRCRSCAIKENKYNQ